MTKSVMGKYGVTLQKIAIMETEKNILTRLSKIQNACASNLLYYGKNRQQLEKKYNDANISQEQRDIMFKTMDIREKIATDLLNKLNHFNKEFNIPIKRLEISKTIRSFDEIQKQYKKDIMKGVFNGD